MCSSTLLHWKAPLCTFHEEQGINAVTRCHFSQQYSMGVTGTLQKGTSLGTPNTAGLSGEQELGMSK